MIIPAKKQVYLNEFNILMEKTVYLPLVSGMLTASSLEVPRIRDEYEFMPLDLFHRSSIEDLIQDREYENPSVALRRRSCWRPTGTSVSGQVWRRSGRTRPSSDAGITAS